jgi:hypothetical protein
MRRQQCVHDCAAEAPGLAARSQVASAIVFVVIHIERRRESREVADDFGVVRPVQHIEADPSHVKYTLGKHDFPLTIDLKHTVVELIGNERVTIVQPDAPSGQRHRVTTGHGVCCVSPNDLVRAVDLDNPIVVRVRNQCVAIVKPTGKRDAAGRAAG